MQPSGAPVTFLGQGPSPLIWSKDKIKIFTEIQPSTVELETIQCNILLYNNYSITPNTHTHTFNGPFSATTLVSRYQKGKTNLDFIDARDNEWQWHHMAICKSAPSSRHITMPAPHYSVFYRSDALPAPQPTASKHWRQLSNNNNNQTLKLITKNSRTVGGTLPPVGPPVTRRSSHPIVMPLVYTTCHCVLLGDAGAIPDSDIHCWQHSWCHDESCTLIDLFVCVNYMTLC